MILGRKYLSALVALVLTPFAFAQAGTVHGTVKNGTTGKVEGGVEVILIQLQGWMQPVANSKTDAQGQFSFDNPSIGAQPMLVRAVYRGVNFHQPLPPGTNDVQVEVFDPTQDPKTITVASHVIIFQPNGSMLTVGEEYSIQNNSQPRQAYFKTAGNFEFALPAGAKLQQAAAWGPSGMPVVQATMDKPNDHYAIAYAFRPGESGVRYSYELPYPGNAATVKIPTLYPGARLLVVAPPTVQISGDGLQSGGQEQGMNIYGRDGVPANTTLAVNVSGTAPPQQGAPNGAPDAGGQASDAQGAGAAAASANIQQAPSRLDALKWPVIGGFVALFALGAVLLARRPVVAVAGVGTVAHDPLSSNSKVRSSPTANVQRGKVKSFSLSEVDAAVNVSLDSLKDQIFRLELRRQAGTISEEEYAQERARAEKVLRDLVRG